MLQGVEILSQKVVTGMTFNFGIFIIGVIFTIILAVIVSVLLSTNSLFNIICIIGFIISIVLGVVYANSSESYTQYKVTISDTVNFVEFNEKYEIIFQDGKIYTIKERIDE